MVIVCAIFVFTVRHLRNCHVMSWSFQKCLLSLGPPNAESINVFSLTAIESALKHRLYEILKREFSKAEEILVTGGAINQCKLATEKRLNEF